MVGQILKYSVPGHLKGIRQQFLFFVVVPHVAGGVGAGGTWTTWLQRFQAKWLTKLAATSIFAEQQASKSP